MFRQFKRDTANRLSDEVEPNKLTWTSSDGENALSEEPEGLDEAEDDAEEDDELDPDSPEAKKAAEEKAAALQAELEREAEEYGLTGSDVTRVYGPNGEDVAALIDSLMTIDDETAEAIADAYEAVPVADRKVVQRVIGRKHRGGKYESELWSAENAVAEWLASLMLNEDSAQLYAIVAGAATDAVDALVLGDELADVDFNTLYGPWADVMDAEEDEEAGAEAASPDLPAASATDGASEDADEEVGELGPNTGLVLEFLAKLAALSAAEISELVAAWRDQPKEDLRIAHRNLQALADEDPKWREQLRLAQEEVFAWMSGRTASTVGRNTSVPDYSFGGKTMARARETAGPVAADAVAALAMADILEDEDAETLYAPWADVIGEPALPEYEDDETDEGDGEGETN
jgi:hypothetical protein